MFHLFLNQDGTNIYSRQIGQETYHQGFREAKLLREKSECELYNMILEMEAIELHKLARTIEGKGGQVLDLSTDSVSCVCPNDVLPFEVKDVNGKMLVAGFYYDVKQAKHRYKLEDKERLKYDHTPRMHRSEKYELQPYQWKIIKDDGDNDFTKYVIQIIISNHSIHIDRRGGRARAPL